MKKPMSRSFLGYSTSIYHLALMNPVTFVTSCVLCSFHSYNHGIFSFSIHSLIEVCCLLCDTPLLPSVLLSLQMYGVKRIVEENGFFEDRNTIKRNLKINFLATEDHVTLASAGKHLSLMETVISSDELRQEISVINHLLNGNLGIIRELVSKNCHMEGTDDLISALDTFKVVIENAGKVDQKLVVSQVFALAKHVIENVHGSEMFCDHIKNVMEEQIHVGIYGEEWLKSKILV